MNKTKQVHLHVVPEPNDNKSIPIDILIEQYVASQQFTQAENLVALDPCEYMYSIYIDALYRHGDTELAKKKLLEYECKIKQIEQNMHSYAYFLLTWIKAVIAYDEGNYAEAAQLFETLTLHHPQEGQAYYALASSSLHENIQNLRRRIELYHPTPQEVDKINTYITHLTKCIQIVDATGWHPQDHSKAKNPIA
jgi:tetratricopeptide (TPR) repeat protein